MQIQAQTTKKQRKRNARRNHRGRPGVASVEMAMVAPFVFMLIFGSVEFSRMMMVRQAITNAARDGCRNACLATATNTNDSDQVIRDGLNAVVSETDDTSKLRVVFTPSFTSTPAAGTAITTHIEIDCADVSWLPPTFFSGARISGRASMIRE